MGPICETAKVHSAPPSLLVRFSAILKKSKAMSKWWQSALRQRFLCDRQNWIASTFEIEMLEKSPKFGGFPCEFVMWNWEGTSNFTGLKGTAKKFEKHAKCRFGEANSKCLLPLHSKRRQNDRWSHSNLFVSKPLAFIVIASIKKSKSWRQAGN